MGGSAIPPPNIQNSDQADDDDDLNEECARTKPKPATLLRAKGEKKPNSKEALKAREKKEKRKRRHNRRAVSLLTAILFYFKETDKYPFQDLFTMTDFACKLPFFRRHPAELRSEIRKLRDKYKKLVTKHGRTLMIMDILSQEVFQLWKEIWGKKRRTDHRRQPEPPQPNMDPPPPTDSGPNNQPLTVRST